MPGETDKDYQEKKKIEISFCIGGDQSENPKSRA